MGSPISFSETCKRNRIPASASFWESGLSVLVCAPARPDTARIVPASSAPTLTRPFSIHGTHAPAPQYAIIPEMFQLAVISCSLILACPGHDDTLKFFRYPRRLLANQTRNCIVFALSRAAGLARHSGAFAECGTGRQDYAESWRSCSGLYPSQRSMEDRQALGLPRQEKCLSRRLRPRFHRWLNEATSGGPGWTR